MTSSRRFALIALLTLPLSSALEAQSQLQGIPGAYYAMSHEPSMMMRAEGFEYDHESWSRSQRAITPSPSASIPCSG